jgi:hypothetical protein
LPDSKWVVQYFITCLWRTLSIMNHEWKAFGLTFLFIHQNYTEKQTKTEWLSLSRT